MKISKIVKYRYTTYIFEKGKYNATIIRDSVRASANIITNVNILIENTDIEADMLKIINTVYKWMKINKFNKITKRNENEYLLN